MERKRNGQDRRGSTARRKLEWEVIVDQVRRRKHQFITRLERNITHTPEGCALYRGTLDHNGYPRINFRYNGSHVTIHAYRLFAILKHRAPLPVGYDAAHMPGCTSRRCVRHVEVQHYSVNARTRGEFVGVPF